MKPASFNYVKPTSIEHTLELLNQDEKECKIIAGGQSLLPTLNMRLSAPDLLIDISGLQELAGISEHDDHVRIGALTRHAEVEMSNLIATRVPLLNAAINHVAHAAIRNRGTIGGNLSLADPASELPACTVALDAKVTILSRDGDRTVSARDYFKDLYETDLKPDEILLSVSFPFAEKSSRYGFREFVRRRGDFASTGLVVNADMQGDQLASLSPVFFAIANTPVLAENTAARLINVPLNDENIKSAMVCLEDELEIIGDIHTSKEMKMHLAKHFFKEILEEFRG